MKTPFSLALAFATLGFLTFFNSLEVLAGGNCDGNRASEEVNGSLPNSCENYKFGCGCRVINCNERRNYCESGLTGKYPYLYVLYLSKYNLITGEETILREVARDSQFATEAEAKHACREALFDHPVCR